MSDLEQSILRNLQYNEDYARKVLPFIKETYFLDNDEKLYFKRLNEYFEKYNALPSKEAMDIDFNNLSISQQSLDNLLGFSKQLREQSEEKTNTEWLLDQTEKFCKDKSLYLALMDSIAIAQGENENLSTTAIPDLLSEALSVSFDTNIGHDYYSDTDKRYDFFNKKVNKVPFHLACLNKITDGGVEFKTVNCLAGGTGSGKSAMLCDFAGAYVEAGYDTLYITLEMAEEKISQRIDANLMGISLNDIGKLPKAVWDEKVSKLKTKSHGKLIVKEYPTSSAHVGHFRYLLKELKQKKNFVPKIIIVDYMNICSSSKIKTKSSMYEYIKSIAEELRGLAVEQNVIMWTATQLNRDGVDNSEADIKNISESFGGPMTFDMLLAIIVSEQLTSNGQVMIKQLKNRFSDVFVNSKFMVGVDRSKMKYFDLDNTQVSIIPAKSPTASTTNKKPNFTGVKA